MPDYRRAFQPGDTFLFTLVTERRARFLTNDEARPLLRRALGATRERMPFDLRAIVLLPDHLHMMWTLPEGDHDFSRRMAFFKKEFTKARLAAGGVEQPMARSRQRNRRRGIWQRRFWEHTIRDDDDFRRHCDYIHFNAVKHGVASCPHAWPYSSFDRFVREEFYDADWQCACDGPRPAALDFTDINTTAME